MQENNPTDFMVIVIIILCCEQRPQVSKIK